MNCFYPQIIVISCINVFYFSLAWEFTWA